MAEERKSGLTTKDTKESEQSESRAKEMAAGGVGVGIGIGIGIESNGMSFGPASD